MPPWSISYNATASAGMNASTTVPRCRRWSQTDRAADLTHPLPHTHQAVRLGPCAAPSRHTAAVIDDAQANSFRFALQLHAHRLRLGMTRTRS